MKNENKVWMQNFQGKCPKCFKLMTCLFRNAYLAVLFRSLEIILETSLMSFYPNFSSLIDVHSTQLPHLLHGFSIQPLFSAPNTTVMFLLHYHNSRPASRVAPH